MNVYLVIEQIMFSGSRGIVSHNMCKLIFFIACTDMICRRPTAMESLAIDTIKTPASQFTVLLLTIVLILLFLLGYVTLLRSDINASSPFL